SRPEHWRHRHGNSAATGTKFGAAASVSSPHLGVTAETPAAAGLSAGAGHTRAARFWLMEHQRGFQRDCHPAREDEESLLDVEDVQACPTIWHIADVTQANWNTNKDRLAGPERQASDRSAPGGPWNIGRHIQRLACGRQRPPGRDAGLFWPRRGDRLNGDRHWSGILDALGHGEDAALRRYVDVAVRVAECIDRPQTHAYWHAWEG